MYVGGFRTPDGVRKPSPCVEALEPDQLDDLTSKLAADPDLQMHLRGAFQNFEGIKAPTKLYIESRVEAAAPMDQKYNAEVVRWYDHWLKGVDNGIMDEPPIRIHVRGSGFREEREWPLARTEWTRFHLHRWSGLSTDPEPVEGYPDTFVQQPPYISASVQRADYLTPPLVAFYDRNGVKPWSKSSPNGRLILTEDGPSKGLDSKAIHELIDGFWGK